MDELEFSKFLGAGCAALLAFVGFEHLAGAMVSTKQVETPVYQIVLEDAGVEEVAEEIDLSSLLASADLAKGAKVFKSKCSSCHKLQDGANGTGPHLTGVVGRVVGGVDSFTKYSGKLPSGEAWTHDNLFAFLEKPKSWAPGTSMGFAGLKKPADRAAVIAYLEQN